MWKERDTHLLLLRFRPTPLVNKLFFLPFPLLLQEEVPEKFPVMVFSHGLGGMRTTYSYICADIASHGWVVAAVEHRDGSASIALTNSGPVTYEHPEKGVLHGELENHEQHFLSSSSAVFEDRSI